ncbi:MAG TPA: DUF1572 family protein [Chitinophagaceae bacterium]|nr:DUF1572 family protein [Chitinophagaceae bacterium]
MNIFLQSAISRLRYYKELADKTFLQLEDTDFHFQPSSQSNSLAVIIRHMSGNMLSRWTNFLTEDGEKPWRQRDEEFNTRFQAKEELLEIWSKGWDCLLGTLETLTEEDLLKTVYIRHEPLTVTDAINRQLAHYPYHVGQIVFIGKMIRDDKWQSLSIEKDKSDEFNEGMKNRHSSPKA